MLLDTGNRGRGKGCALIVGDLEKRVFIRKGRVWVVLKKCGRCDFKISHVTHKKERTGGRCFYS